MTTEPFKLDSFSEGIYLHYLNNNLFKAKEALEMLEKAYDSDDVNLLGDVIEIALNSCALCSKLLTGKKNNHHARRRGAYLRESLEISNDDPILDRKLRDAIEHFDERLDSWVEHCRSSGQQLFFDFGHIGGIKEVHKYQARAYSPHDGNFKIFGEVVNLFLLRESVRSLWRKLGDRMDFVKQKKKEEAREFLQRRSSGL